jgi:flagellar basal-body rod protein FlgG
MNDAFYIGATGMQAQQTSLNTIANNLVNANTPGYKKSAIAFTDLVAAGSTRLEQGAGALVDAGLLAPLQQRGAGVGVGAVSKRFDAGELKQTNAPMDVAIRGDGFLELSMPDGSTAYTRGGTLKVNRDGLLATQAGYPLKPAIAVPENVQSLTIDQDGRVSIQVTGQAAPLEAGQLQLVRFNTPEQLLAQGDNLYRAGDGAGEALSGDGAGQIAQGFLEASNVRMVDEVTNLMLAQRAYESSVKVVQAADEMQAMINNLRK